jgi:hypothetical protein
MMTPDQERWAEALAVLRMHGDGALAHAEARITTLMQEGDDAGMLRWFEIFERIEELQGATGTTH